MSIRILINGANGRLGALCCDALTQQADFELVARCGREDDLASAIAAHQPQVVLDVTTAAAVYENTRMIIEQGVRPVIGTSGLSAEQIVELQAQCDAQQLGGLIVPNFALGAVLMMKFAKLAASYFPHVEIVERHHEQKRDAPSGTARYTAQLIREQQQPEPTAVQSQELLAGSRGAKAHDVPIHSIRMRGLIAEQQVLFSNHGESLSIEHITRDRDCMLPGVLLACRKVLTLNRLVYGLEHVLD